MPSSADARGSKGIPTGDHGIVADVGRPLPSEDELDQRDNLRRSPEDTARVDRMFLVATVLLTLLVGLLVALVIAVL
jgi:hypothetical protein